MEYASLSPAELSSLHRDLSDKYEEFRAESLNLDLTRGKPSAEQLDLSNELDGILEGFFLLQDGTDVRNYGGILGIPEARALGADIMGLDPAEVLAGGNSSLTLMYQYIDYMHRHAHNAWYAESVRNNKKIKFLCPVPGYDRHFTICEHFDIEMLTVPMTETGPDMDQVEAMVKQDPLIKGIWCVPKYSNPTGYTYDSETVGRLAALPAIAGDNFRVMWDNAYVVHHLGDEPASLENIMAHARKLETESGIVVLASTSKITFAGAGVAFLGTSVSNLADFEKYLSAQVIGFDKVNQLRHVRFLRDMDTLLSHMDKHKAIIKPKFDLVLTTLEEHLGGTGTATWTTPNGGYFISLDTMPGLATEVIRLAADVGVKLTPAGATFPYGVDPKNANIRIAPTFPAIAQVKKAVEVFVVCVQLASANKLLGH